MSPQKRPELVDCETLKTLQTRLRERLAALGISGNEASRRAGGLVSLSYVNDIISGSSKNPAMSRLQAVADVLECDVGYLIGAQDELRLKGAAGFLKLPSARRHSDEATVTIPLFASNWPDVEGFFAMKKEADETTGLPFADVPGGYAVMVPDDASAPRYRAGEVVFVNPRRPIAPGAFVVIRTVDDKAMIREVVKVTSTSIEVQCSTEKAKRTFKRDEISSIHRITASAET